MYHDAVGYAKRQFDLESVQCLPSSHSTTQPQNSRSAQPPSGVTSKTAASPATGGGWTAKPTSTARNSEGFSGPSRSAKSPNALKAALVYVRQSRHKDYERTASPEVQEAACRALPAVARCDKVEVF